MLQLGYLYFLSLSNDVLIFPKITLLSIFVPIFRFPPLTSFVSFYNSRFTVIFPPPLCMHYFPSSSFDTFISLPLFLPIRFFLHPFTPFCVFLFLFLFSLSLYFHLSLFTHFSFTQSVSYSFFLFCDFSSFVNKTFHPPHHHHTNYK